MNPWRVQVSPMRYCRKSKVTDTTLDWYFDYVSPFAYLQLKQFHRLPDHVLIRPVPVLFAGLLDHYGQKGPAEIEPKRAHTYRYCQWYAERHDISFRMPPAHPFNPLKLLRWTIQRPDSLEFIQVLFDGIFARGMLPSDPTYWDWVSRTLGESIDAGQAFSPEVKAVLRENTEAMQVFGVPTFRLDGINYWGMDATDMVLQAVHDPGVFTRGEYARLAGMPTESTRRTF